MCGSPRAIDLRRMASRLRPAAQLGVVRLGLALRSEAIFQFIGAFNPDQPPGFWAEVANAAVWPETRLAWESFASEHSVIVVWSPTPEEWSRITQPALVLEGDAAWMPELAAKVAELLSQGDLGTLDGLDHMAPVEAPTLVAQRIIEFVDRHQRA